MQTYSAKVASVLPVLLSAIRASPPSDGPAHAGKEIGKDVVSYEYNQVSCSLVCSYSCSSHDAT